LPEAQDLEAPSALKPFACLEELDFSFNLVAFQKDLLFPAKNCERLKILVITGNPFALTGVVSKFNTLEKLMERKGGVLVNETPQMQQAKAGQVAQKQLDWAQTQHKHLSLMNPLRASVKARGDNVKLFDGMDHDKNFLQELAQAPDQPTGAQPVFSRPQPGFFLTENQPNEDNGSHPVSHREAFHDEEEADFGKAKMDVFKHQCR
jgi:hypothetical protein